MENELEENIAGNNEKNQENIFKLDFKGQSLKSNKKFGEWKEKMKLKNDKNAILYYCKNDNLYFYGTLTYYGSECPLCKDNICYFCLRNTNICFDCCPLGRVYRILSYDALFFIKENDQNYEYDYGDNYNFCDVFSKFILPFYTFIYLAGIISNNLYHSLFYPREKDPERVYYFRDNNQATFINIIINALMALILSIIFFIHDIYFKFLLLFFSLFPKHYPIKYYLRILKMGMEQFT